MPLLQVVAERLLVPPDAGWLMLRKLLAAALAAAALELVQMPAVVALGLVQLVVPMPAVVALGLAQLAGAFGLAAPGVAESAR